MRFLFCKFENIPEFRYKQAPTPIAHGIHFIFDVFGTSLLMNLKVQCWEAINEQRVKTFEFQLSRQITNDNQSRITKDSLKVIKQEIG